MQFFRIVSALLPVIACVVAAPSQSGKRGGPSTCDNFGTISSGSYIIHANEWGASSDEGSQCTQINNLSGNTLSWSTSWHWMNNTNQVKSYTNAQSYQVSCKPLSQIKSLYSSWSWSYTGNDLRCNAAYDTFLGTSCGASNSYEVMIWLGVYGGVSPLSDNGYPPTPTDTPTIAGTKFNLILGTNGPTKVFSFVAQQNAENFSGDLMNFYQYLASHQGLDLNAQYLMNVEAGTEVFTGSNAVFTTNGYSISSS